MSGQEEDTVWSEDMADENFLHHAKAGEKGSCEICEGDKDAGLIQGLRDLINHVPLMSGERPEKPFFNRSTGSYFYKKMHHFIAPLSYEALVTASKSKVDPTVETQSTSTFKIINESMCIHASTGEKLLVFWKAGYNRPWGPGVGESIKSKLATSVDTLAEAYPPPLPTKKDVRHEVEEMEERKRRFSPQELGVYHFCWWHATGQTKSKLPVISKEALGSGGAHRYSIPY